MTPEELMSAIQKLEQQVVTALEEDDLPKVSALEEQACQYVRQLADAPKTSEQEAYFREFAKAYSEHARDMIQKLTVVRQNTRAEIIKIHKGTKGSSAYGKMRFGRR